MPRAGRRTGLDKVFLKKPAFTLGIFIASKLLATSAFAEQKLLDTFDMNPQSRWDYLADTVMGGFSTGQVSFEAENGSGFARLTGSVSTENRDGFIQLGTELTETPAKEAKGMLTSQGHIWKALRRSV